MLRIGEKAVKARQREAGTRDCLGGLSLTLRMAQCGIDFGDCGLSQRDDPAAIGDEIRGAPGAGVRSEGRKFPVGRCLVPASHFFEFTGTKAPKTKWKFTKAGEDWFCFAGLWRPMAAGGEAFTLLTTEPSPDVAPIHDRQMVVDPTCQE